MKEKKPHDYLNGYRKKETFDKVQHPFMSKTLNKIVIEKT